MAGLNMNSSLRKSPTRPADIQSPSQKTYAGIVFNPYEVTSYTNNKRIESICNNQAICEYYVSNMMLSGGKLNSDKAEGYYVYFYRVSAINIAYWLQQVGINDEEPNKQLLCFYDKAIVSLLNKEKKTGDAVLCAVKKEDEELFGYFHLGKGAVQKKNEEYLYSRSIIPREFFESINDYVYIAICSKEETAPVVILQEIPCGIPTFWDLPVATALYEKQHLYDSHIVLGSVRVFSKKTNSRPTSMPRSEIVEEDRWDLDPSFTYTWIRPSQTVSLNKKPYFRTMKTSAYVLIYKEEAYRCPSVEVNIYKDKLSEGASSFFAFSFRSGNEDDLVKKSYLTEKDPYNAYSLLLDSLSVATVFCSFPSIKKPIENAARYLLRTLAKQPVGLRCLSIDGAPLSALMGGALYEIGAIVSQSKETIEANSDYLWALAKMNDSQLFYNSPVRYDISARGKSNAELNRALFFLKTVLGIQENSSGCERIKELLKDLFKFFKDNHVEINYFFSDIELMSSGSRALALRRFKEAYAKLFSEDLSSFLTDIVVPKEEYTKEDIEIETFPTKYIKQTIKCRTII